MKKTQSKSKAQSICEWLDAEYADNCEKVACIYRALTFDESEYNQGYECEHTHHGWLLHGHSGDLQLSEQQRKAMIDFLDQSCDLGVLLQLAFERTCVAIDEDWT